MIVLSLQVEDYDTSSSLFFHAETASSNELSTGSVLVHRLFGWAAKWDGAYFTQIAHSSSWTSNGAVLGYELEHFHAFFPLLPMLMASGSVPLQWFGLSSPAATILSGVLVSNVAFVLSVVVLFRYSCFVYRRGQPDCPEGWVPQQALVAALLYCFNPASVFMSAIYTEALFGCLSITGLLVLHSSERRWGPRWWASALLFAGCSATRSNGVLYVGYALWEVLHGPGVAAIFGLSSDVSVTCSSYCLNRVRSAESRQSKLEAVKTILSEVVGIVLYASVVVMPLAVYQRCVMPGRQTLHMPRRFCANLNQSARACVNMIVSAGTHSYAIAAIL